MKEWLRKHNIYCKVERYPIREDKIDYILVVLIKDNIPNSLVIDVFI